MKFSKLSQLFLVSSIGLLVATLLTACQLVTIDYVYVASSANLPAAADRSNLRGGFAVRRIAPGGAAVSSGGAIPVALAVTPDY